MVCSNRFVIFLITFKLASCCTDNLCREAVFDISTKIRHLATKTIPGHYLNVTALETVEVISDRYCLHRCLKNDECFSMNLYTNGRILECSLLTEQTYTNVTELVTNKSSVHLTIRNSFCEDLCKNGGTCIPDYETDSGSCLCTNGFVGKTTPTNQPQVTVFAYSVLTDTNINDLLQLDAFLTQSAIERSCIEEFRLDVMGYQGKHTLAYFTPTETGNHRFTMVCKYKCRMYITTKGKYDRRAVAGFGSIGPAFLSNKEKSLHLKEGEKYLIEYIGKATVSSAPKNTVAILFPSGHIVDPLDADYLSAD